MLAMTLNSHNKNVQQYCYTCHHTEVAGLLIQQLVIGAVQEQFSVWHVYFCTFENVILVTVRFKLDLSIGCIKGATLHATNT